MNGTFLRQTRSELQSYSSANKYIHQQKSKNSPKRHSKSFHSDAFKTKYDSEPIKILNRQIPLHYPYHIPLPSLQQGRQTHSTLNPQMSFFDLSRRQGYQTLSPKRKSNAVKDFMANTYLSRKSKKFILNRFQHKDEAPKKWFQRRVSSRQTTRLEIQQFVPLGVKRNSKSKFTEQRQMKMIQSGRRQMEHQPQPNVNQFFKVNINTLKETLQNQRKAAGILQPRKGSRRKSSLFIQS